MRMHSMACQIKSLCESSHGSLDEMNRRNSTGDARGGSKAGIAIRSCGSISAAGPGRPATMASNARSTIDGICSLRIAVAAKRAHGRKIPSRSIS